MPVFVLSIHADYACRRSGACCSAAWRIPVEPACEDRIAGSTLEVAGGTAGGSLFERDGRITVLTLAPDGACALFRGGAPGSEPGCAIYGVFGHEALPSACRHFPRVAVTDDCGTFVTLSHYCPTAAAMLFREDLELSVVEAPPSFHSVMMYEGLDARAALPPLLTPGMLMDLPSHHAWERHIVRTFADAAHTPESALDRLAQDAASLSGWHPGGGSLGSRLATLPGREYGTAEAVPHATACSRSHASGPRSTSGRRDTESAGRETSGRGPCAVGLDDDEDRLYELVRSSVPAGLDAAPAERLDDMDDVFVRPAWSAFSTPIKRFLAAKAFASWIPWHSGGVSTTVASVAAARAVLRVEAGRQCARAGRVLDRKLLIEAVRQADLLLVHKAASRTLARRLAAWELATRSPGNCGVLED